MPAPQFIQNPRIALIHTSDLTKSILHQAYLAKSIISVQNEAIGSSTCTVRLCLYLGRKTMPYEVNNNNNTCTSQRKSSPQISFVTPTITHPSRFEGLYTILYFPILSYPIPYYEPNSTRTTTLDNMQPRLATRTLARGAYSHIQPNLASPAAQQPRLT